MNEVLRQEKKFLVTLEQYYALSHSFSHVLHPDENSNGDGYLVRSLYFDSLDDRDFTEKEDGLFLRRKIRLRCYGPASGFAILEMKQKQGAMQKKRSLRLDRTEAQALSQGDYAPLLRHGEPFASECYATMRALCYRPKAVISYHRKAFVARENRIRVTFDHHLCGTESSADLFADPLPEYPLLDPALAVLEIKYNGFLLSYIKDALRALDGSELSVSKYCLGRAVSKHYTF